MEPTLIGQPANSGPESEDIDMANPTENGQGNTHTTAADVRAVVENARKAKDENSDDDSDDDDGDDADGNDGEGDDEGADDSADDTTDSDDADDSDEEGEDDEDEDNSDDSKSQKKSQRKYQQYAGDGSDEQYISNVEKALQNSTKEAVSMRTELNQANARVDAVMRAVATNPELAKALREAVGKDGSGAGSDDDSDGGSGSDSGVSNPFLSDLQARWTETSEKEIEEFIEANPEVASDPKIKADVQHWMGVFSREYKERNNGKLLSGGEAMAQAYKYLGLENKLDKQALAAGAKKTAAPTRPRGKGKKSNGQKPTFTPSQLAMAKQLGKDETWLAKNAK